VDPLSTRTLSFCLNFRFDEHFPFHHVNPLFWKEGSVVFYPPFPALSALPPSPFSRPLATFAESYSTSLGSPSFLSNAFPPFPPLLSKSSRAHPFWCGFVSFSLLELFFSHRFDILFFLPFSRQLWLPLTSCAGMSFIMYVCVFFHLSKSKNQH